ncbi:putative Translation elongation factor eEF-1B gamma subunit [Seiridium unicorne]|uniref:Translation elongation factor eEF-1B gamma subunit n=1 Tax=Seiridium unicorne TaxID=138068 RepID=A0ABR2UY04_9PEZI
MVPYCTSINGKGLQYTLIRAAAILNGLELEVPVDFEPDETSKTHEFLTKFPLAKMPAFGTPSGFILARRSAIATYIAESGPKRDRLIGGTPEDRARNQQWILFNDIHVEASLWSMAA